MQITATLQITMHKNGTISYVNGADWGNHLNSSDGRYNALKEIYYATMHCIPSRRDEIIKGYIATKKYPEIFERYGSATMEGFNAEVVEDIFTPAVELTAEEALVRGLNGLMNFFSEFAFEPSFRFTNTLAFNLQKSKEQAKSYISHYFNLMDSSYKDEINDKMKSVEFNSILEDISKVAPSSAINSRFKIYYGSAGTGKTTKGMMETENRCVVCNSSMLPSDLMEDFVFTDGNPDFKESILWNCMEQGKAIVLDEINLLPFDSLRFLQGIVDGKTEFSYKNRPVHIHDGFQIIGTMNLTIGGMAYGLPEPLVDRCCDIQEFKLTAEQLAKSIMG